MENTSEVLGKIAAEFDEFWEKELTTQNRKELFNLITKYTQNGTFVRKDVGKEVHLYYGSTRMNHGMAPDITITVARDSKKIYAVTDCFWRTISGIHEAEQERRAYEGKWRG